MSPPHTTSQSSSRIKNCQFVSVRISLTGYKCKFMGVNVKKKENRDRFLRDTVFQARQSGKFSSTGGEGEFLIVDKFYDHLYQILVKEEVD